MVQWLDHFCNFSDSVDKLLNNAANTEGADHFSDFRSFKFFARDREVSGKWVKVGVMQCHANYRLSDLMQCGVIQTIIMLYYLKINHNTLTGVALMGHGMIRVA